MAKWISRARSVAKVRILFEVDRPDNAVLSRTQDGLDSVIYYTSVERHRICILATSTSFAGPKSRWIECTSQKNSSHIAVLTFLPGGNLQWEETWRSASSIGEPNSSEEFGDIYELTDFYSDEDGGFQLVLTPEFVASKYSNGIVEVLFKSTKADSYLCNNNLKNNR